MEAEKYYDPNLFHGQQGEYLQVLLCERFDFKSDY